MSAPILVRLTHADVGLAAQWAGEVLASGIEQTPNYTGIAVPDRFLVGYIGELAFASWADSMRCLVRHRVQVGGRSDAPEFIVWMRHAATTLDVKTASMASHARLMMPAAQPLDAALYVAARVVSLPNRLVELCGWLDRDGVLACSVEDFGHGPTRACPLGQLRDMRELLSVLDERCFVERTARHPCPPTPEGTSHEAIRL